MAKVPPPLTRIREAAGISRKQLASALKITRQRCSQVEGGAPVPAVMALRLVELYPAECDALGLTLDAILRYGRTFPSGKLRREGRGRKRAAAIPAEGADASA